MEFDENPVSEEQDSESVEIYSKKAIWWFSVLPAPVFGAALLAINLNMAGYKKAIAPVMIFAVVYTIAVQFLIYKISQFYGIAIPDKMPANNQMPDTRFLLLVLLIIVLNFIGGAILTGYFFKKHFPDNDYYPKSVVAPLIVAVVLMLLRIL